MNTGINSGSETQDSGSSIVTVNIFGAEYALRAGSDPEYIRRVARHVDELMREISGRAKNASATKLAVLAALQLTDQVLSAQKDKSAGQADLRELAEKTDSLLSRLDQTLLEVVE